MRLLFENAIIMRKKLLLLLAMLPIMVVFARGDEEDVKDVQEWGTITFDQLKGQTLWGTMTNELTFDTLDPTNFDYTIEISSAFMYESPKVHLEGDKVFLDIRPKGDWCECLFPKNLYIKLCSTPKAGAFAEEGYHFRKTVHPIHLVVVKNRTWFGRCFWVLVSIIGLLLLFFYLRALFKKRRFKKNAMVTPITFGRFGEEVTNNAGQLLRKKGFAAWLARWFWPKDEKNTLSFPRFQLNSITFVATESQDVVELLKANFDERTMEVDGFDPNNDPHPEGNISVANNSCITKFSVGKALKQGRLRFTSNDETDGGGYRVFLSLLMTAVILADIGLIYLLIRSFV